LLLFEETSTEGHLSSKADENKKLQKELREGQLKILREKGIVCQVNAASLYGRYGEPAAKLARKILTNQWAHFLASDAHRPGSSPILGRGISIIKDSVSEEYLRYLTVDAGDAITTGRALPALPVLRPIAPKKEPWTSRIFGRR
jgi:protein-tyrosine phosphatase